MNIDFHYYGTYVAARIAGYSYEDASIIAHSAQYVDDSEESRLVPALLPQLDPIPTVQSVAELLTLGSNLYWSEENLIKTRKVWVPFHFLPGNYGSNKKTYNGSLNSTDKTGAYSWYYDDEAKEQFKLIALPNSILVEEMINDIIKNHKNKTYELQLIGLRMHVLCDTWAHTYFAGIPAWSLNDVIGSVTNLDDNSTIRYVGTPPLSSFNSYSYLGHGRLGHLPDYPYLRYKFKPQWSGNNSIDKHNPSDYLSAFKQMVTVMRCIREGKAYSLKNLDTLDKEINDMIIKIINTNPAKEINNPNLQYQNVKNEGDEYVSSFLCEVWRLYMRKILINNTALDVPNRYDRDLWLNEAKASKAPLTTNYYYFNHAATVHLNFVDTHLQGNDIYIGANPESHIFEGSLLSKVGYISTPTQLYNHFPTVSDKAINMQLIKATKKDLESGDIIKIKTTESFIDKKNYLGDWNNATGLYYEACDLNISKQKWQILKIAGSPGNKINYEDTVVFKNIHYKEKPYMSYYKIAPPKAPTIQIVTTSIPNIKLPTVLPGALPPLIPSVPYNNYHLTTINTQNETTAFIIKKYKVDYSHRIAGGYANTAIVKSDGTVGVWGDSYYGALNIPKDLKNVISVACCRHVVALKNDGTVVAWGSNYAGQCNTQGITNVSFVGANENYTALVRKDGTVVVLSSNVQSYLTTITGEVMNIPKGLSDVKSLACGISHIVALKHDGTVVAWGHNVYGGCDVPSGLKDVKAIAAGDDFSLALKNDDSLIYWGEARSISSLPLNTKNIKTICAGSNHAALLTNDGKVIVWGGNSSGQCAVPPDVENIIDIAAGNHTMIALKNDGSVIIWGSNSDGERDIPDDIRVF